MLRLFFLAIQQEISISNVFKFTDGTTHVEVVADLELINILTHLSSVGEWCAGTVGLDDEFHASNVVVRRDGSIPSDDCFAIDLCRKEHMFSSRKTKDVFRGWEGKIQHEGVSRQNDLVLQSEGCLLSWVEGQFASLRVKELLFFLGYSLDGGRIQISNVVLFEHFPGLEGVDSVEIFRGISTGVDGNGINTTGVKFKVFGTVIDLVVDNDPNIVIGIVLLDFLHGVDFLLTVVLGSGYRGFFLGFSGHVEQSTETSRRRLLSSLGHPATSKLAWLSGLFELEDMFTVGLLGHVNLQAEHMVISHTH
mmetsp:Transcript_123508/g.345817  ORF Transcript_123508/g.345817 Transcript_123508/m.345817 type:complete len:307 (-) Transcript_123508:398-1318(-)